MNPQVIHAMLSDSSGSVLLVRRRGAVLLGLPGGEIRGNPSLPELLKTLCSRQVGVAPDFAGTLSTFSLSDKTVGLAFAEIPHARAGARGRVEAVFWIRPDKLPPEVDPIARYAIALHAPKPIARPGPEALLSILRHSVA